MENDLKVKIEEIVLAALLHDVGKFLQRADIYKKSDFSEKEMEEFLPKHKGYFSHIHALFSWKFLKDDFPWPVFLENKKDKIAEIAGHHHDSYRKIFEEAVVKWGDRTASAHERAESFENQSVENTPLNSPFSLIKADDEAFFDKGIKLEKLSKIKIENFSQNENALYQRDYQEYFYSFKKALKKIQDSKNFKEYLLKLLNVLEEFWWCIPSAVYKTEADVSLFEHSRLTALLSEVFYLYFKGIGHDTESWIENHKNEEKFFSIVSGDISGIQNFIMGLSKSNDKNGSKIIRGRSFYIQALTKSIILKIQKELNLSPLSLLLDAGGNFSIIIPNLQEYHKKIHEITRELEKYFFEKFAGELFPVISVSDGFLINDFKNNYNEVIKNVREKNENKKRKKFQYLFQQGIFSIPLESKSFEGEICLACEKQPVKNGNVCEICFNALKTGEKLAQGIRNIYYLQGIPENENEFEIIPEIKVLLSNQKNISFSFLYVENNHSGENDEDFYFPKSNIVSYLPTGNNIAMTLEDISKTNKKGRDLLSLFKADIDNLGLIFSKKVFVKRKRDNKEHKDTSISHNTSVSRAITLFWGRLLKDFIKEKFPNIYIVFAGGDDVALIGNYDDILNFSLVIRKHFEKYTANKLTFSAGIFNFHNKFPVKKAINNAEELLEESKKVFEENVISDKPKNKVTVFGETLTWEELKKAKEFAEYIYLKNSREEIGIAFWYRFLKYWQKSKKVITQKDTQFNDLLVLAHATYDINRNIKDETLKKELHRYYDGLCVSNNHKKRLVGLQYGISFSRKLGGKNE